MMKGVGYIVGNGWRALLDEVGGYVIGNDRNDCDWYDVDCDDEGVNDDHNCEGIDEDIDSGTDGVWACDDIVVLDGVINDDVDTM